ncbi:MAG TPA: sensor histidine kinase KdpD [Tepidisphaeraceae bacterium]|nr:sensor histidine kinase KdpD [Tepidisphaeraceae bacterium]
MADDRPNPDQLLAEVREQEAKQRRGRLKVYFGMAAGVGKTFAMLEEARARAAEGLDVVIGYAEPHIRTDTEALLLGMEILPYKLVEYRSAKLKEFDLDAALARRPAILCVDELAHTNAPGMRHLKRWQDVAELLDAGINVYTTLNVQHLESVNDIVERISGVNVRETLPDSVLEQADEVELVDIAPEELLERFREGKVYRAEQAEQAAKHFFTKGNLIALRELALRTTAQRVDAQMQEARREAGVRASWAATERVLVCISPSPMSRRLVRSARRLAASLRADWIAAYVETARSAALPADDRRRIEGTLRLADELGATTVTLSGENVAEEIIAHAQRHNVTKIVIGKPQRPRWRDVIFGSVLDDLVRRSGEIDIHVIRGPGDEQESRTVQPGSAAPSDLRGWTVAAILTAIISAVGWPLHHRFGQADENILMLYLLGVLWVATHHSRSAAVLASFLSVLAYDVIFVPPYYTVAVADRQYVVTFGVMLLAALVISTLTHRVRAQAEAARERERRTAVLFNLSRDLAAARSTEEITSAAVRHVADVIGRRTVLLLSDGDGRLAQRGDSEIAQVVDGKSLGVAEWAFKHGQVCGHGTHTLPASEWTFVPLQASRGPVGVLGLHARPGDDGWPPDRRQLADAFASQTALAVERGKLADEARAAWERVEAEFLRNTLLSGVSHELRTPLAGITGAASALIETGDKLSPRTREELLDTVVCESERMERLINNLLDMTRFESGGLIVKKEWQSVQEVIGAALNHLDRRLHGRRVTTHVAHDLPLVQMDAVLIEQVLVNLLDNAVEYTPPGTTIGIGAARTDEAVVVEVWDEGPGLPPGTEQKVFQKFFRAAASRRGIGLGLAISRGIIDAHGGTISATNRTGGGALFRFTVPLTGAPPPPLPADMMVEGATAPLTT